MTEFQQLVLLAHQKTLDAVKILEAHTDWRFSNAQVQADIFPLVLAFSMWLHTQTPLVSISPSLDAPPTSEDPAIP